MVTCWTMLIVKVAGRGDQLELAKDNEKEAEEGEGDSANGQDDSYAHSGV